jgi:hypothetical protein
MFDIVIARDYPLPQLHHIIPHPYSFTTMVSALSSENAMRFLSEASFETVVCADDLPKGDPRSKSDYFSFPPVQQQETSYREFLFLKEDKSGEASEFLKEAHDAITSWVGKHVPSYQKETGDSSLQGEDDTTVLTAFSADDSQTVPDFMDDDHRLLSDDSERSLPFSVLRQSRISQRLAPLLPGENIRLYEQYEATHKSPGGVWVIRVFKPDENFQGLRFELHQEGDAFAMTLDETDILDNVRVLVETEAGGTEELIFQVRTGMCDKSLEVAGDMIIDHLRLILGMDQATHESPETIDGTPKWNESNHQVWERGEQRPPLLYSASSNNSESPFVRWTISQESRRANLMS